MRYSKYPSYRDSGVEGLEKTPEYWKNYRIDWINTIIRGNTGFKKDELLDNGEYVALQYGKTYKVDEVNETFKFYINGEFYKSSQVVHRGDTILISTSETIEDLGHSCFYNRDDLGLIGGEQILLKPNSELVFEKYLYYSSKVFCNRLNKYATGLKVFRFNIDDLKNIFISIPPLQEQQTIANYLDIATAKIDTLIEKQTKLIELLKEKRQAVISTAVTRGLDNTVAMKDSGVEWLGEIPVHWIIGKIKYYGLYRSGDFISADNIEAEENYPVLGGNGLRGYAKTYNLTGNYVLIGRQGALCGNINYSKDKFWATEHAIVVHNNKNIDVKWLGEILRTMNLNQYSVSAAQPGLAVENIVNLTGVRPPLVEQQEIAKHIDDKTSKIDKLISKSTKAINLLKEKRTALVSSAVTGKIDVREIA